MAALRRLGRRLMGRDGLQAVVPPPAPAILPHVQAHKRLAAERKVEESRAAVDAFTASLDRAMRGQRKPPHRAGQ
jgi:hypothetical protein